MLKFLTSVITGGKFANGAVTAAFSRVLNDQAHERTTAKSFVEREGAIEEQAARARAKAEYNRLNPKASMRKYNFESSKSGEVIGGFIYKVTLDDGSIVYRVAEDVNSLRARGKYSGWGAQEGGDFGDHPANALVVYENHPRFDWSRSYRSMSMSQTFDIYYMSSPTNMRVYSNGNCTVIKGTQTCP